MIGTEDAVTGRERIEEMIRTEIDARRPLDLSREALVLMATSRVRLRETEGEGEGPLVYEILDERREPRKIRRDGRETDMTIADLVDEMAAAHPLLFEPGHPPASAQPISRDWLLVDEADLPAPAASEAPPTPAPEEAAPPRPVTDLPARERIDIPERSNGRGRRAFAMAGLAALAAAVMGATLLFASRVEVSDGEPSKEPSTTGSTALPRSLPPVRTPDMAEAAPEEPAAPPAPAENAPVAGVPEVIDTTTLRIGGEVLRLHGVEWARGGEAEDLRAYLAGREVACRPADQPERVRCEVGGRDLSVVVLYNGGAKATPDAPEELRVAERHAKARGAGVWKN